MNAASAIKSKFSYCSIGLWRQRRDLQTLFGQSPTTKTTYIGWGNKPSGRKARYRAKKHAANQLLLEDGFLKSYFPNDSEPRISYIFDHLGVHYDASCPSTLESCILAASDLSGEILERADAAMSRIRELQLSKYNCDPVIELNALGVGSDKPFILLLDQIKDDLSISGSGATSATFAAMFDEARQLFPDHRLVVRVHPARATAGPLEDYASRHSKDNVLMLRTRCNIWPLLAGADRVFTVSSHAGFEALMQGTPVTCFGMPFYAGWGLTTDRQQCPRRGVDRSLKQVFAAAYIECSRYLDIHDRTPISLETAIDDLACIRDARARNPNLAITVGMSPWKRRAVEPFLIGPSGKPQHGRSMRVAQKMASDAPDAALFLWGADTQKPPSTKTTGGGRLSCIRIEDGFLRSAGLGAALRFPCSIVREAGNHLHFDVSGESALETLIRERKFSSSELERAKALRKKITQAHITKYMVAGSKQSPPDDVRQKILVIGQVEDDASIRLGATDVRTNTRLLERVRELYNDATIAYRDHPDVSAGLRVGKAARHHVDVDAEAYDLSVLFDWCDRVETISSLTGFEALLRGKKVGTHGWPFYAGWGLTDDRLARAQRGSASLDHLVAAALIDYPDYIHPGSRLPCTPERLIEALHHPQKHGVGADALHVLGHTIGRLKHLSAQLGLR